MLSGNKEPLSALWSEMKIVSIMRKMYTPAHFSKKHGKCQRTYINKNKARSMKEIPEQLSVRAIIKKKLLLHSKPNSPAHISHAVSKCHGFTFFFLLPPCVFFWGVRGAASAYQTVDFPADLPTRLRGCTHLTCPCLSFMSMCHSSLKGSVKPMSPSFPVKGVMQCRILHPGTEWIFHLCVIAFNRRVSRQNDTHGLI